MSNALAWVKKNLMIVIFSVIIVAVLPAGFVMSRSWGEQVRSKQEKAANAEMGKVTSASVEYTLPQFEPGAQGVSLRTEPNDSLTAWFREKREALNAQAADIVKRASDFNKGVGREAAALGRREHTPLIDGIFPSFAAGTDPSQKLFEFEDALLGKRGRPDPFRSMLVRARADAPVDPIRLAETLRDMETRETEKIKGAISRELTPEERSRLSQALLERRLGEYRMRAAEISFYASPDLFPTGTGDSTGRPTETELNQLSREGEAKRVLWFFVYQWDLWTYEDILDAVRVANRGGESSGVEGSVVKRIEKITLKRPEGLLGSAPIVGDASRANLDPLTGEIMAPTAAVAGMVPTDPNVSITGRAGASWNPMYDVRRASMTAVVSSARLNEFVAAIHRTNFMTVTDLDASPVDVYEDLREGYYYGAEHVVRVKVEIECVYLRSWMTSIMPSIVKELMGIKPPPTDEGGQG
ncbi:MAG: hypothetical protein HUU18_13005 [Phycisphaerales bacterium]|nr:hypothetical protein [Phycisphaerales bacterium]NUQ69178.1 hypothetical protein [Phycisphaerales bacterium]